LRAIRLLWSDFDVEGPCCMLHSGFSLVRGLAAGAGFAR
jgi:hypothetical protein